MGHFLKASLRYCLIGFLLPHSLGNASALHSPFEALEPGTKLKFSADFTQSTANYSDDGESVGLGADNSFENYLFTGVLDHYFPSNASITVGIETSYSKSSTLIEDRERFGLANFIGGLRYAFTTRQGVVEPEFVITFPLSTNDTSSDEVYINDGYLSLIPGIHAGYNSGIFAPRGYIGYDIRGEGRSHLLRYFAGLGFDFGFIGIEPYFEGFDSVSDDDETGTATDRLLSFSRVNAGSLFFDSVNPAANYAGTNVHIELFDNLSLTLGADLTLSGVRYAEQFRAHAILDILLSETEIAEIYAPPSQPNYNGEDFVPEASESERLFDEATRPKKKR